MFTCPKCLHRALQGLTAEASLTSASHNSRLAILLATSCVQSSTTRHNGIQKVSPTQRRSAATMASLRKGHHRRLAKQSLSGKNDTTLFNKRRKAPLALTKVELNDAVARARNRALRTRVNEVEDEEEDLDENEDGPGDQGDEVRPSQIDEGVIQASKLMDKMKSKTDKAEKVQMAKLKRDVEKYYTDPLQLAKGVLEKLRVPDINGALALVRASESFEINNTVSWNHCMDWLMSQGEYKTSIKIYNEMKKRGKKPDAFTYTIMLSGLAQHAKHPAAVQEAVKMYNSMSAPNSTVRPNLIHTNAIINVCARGGDMETLWAVASKLPERGSGCPDRTTYTTILNALRENTIRKAALIADRANRQVKTEGASEERLALFRDALENGRKLWSDISYRWRRADLVLDEQLVCAMGRLILGCGTGSDHEQVFDLVETSMNVRIPERRGRAQKALSTGDAETVVSDFETGQGEDSKELPLSESSVYATPGSNTLSMVLEAALLYKQRADLGKSYWHLLTKPEGRFRIKPDAGNILSYLRILRRTHSSSEVYQVLVRPWPDDVVKNLFKRSTFIVAFAACARDKNNPNVFSTARKLLTLCNEKLEEKAMGMFEENMELGDMTYEQRKKALQERKAEFKNMTDDELADYNRSQDGVLSLTTDPKLLRYFIDLAVDTTQGWNEGIRGLDDGQIFERNPSKNHTMIALDTIGPFLPTFYQLLRSKLDEVQLDALSMRKQTSRRTKFSTPTEQSQVGENTEELVALTRSMIAAYDKILVAAERFERKNMTTIDTRRLERYDRNKRQLHAFMARIEATVRSKLRQKAAESDKKDLDKAADEDDENPVPEIERKIRAVLEGVDGVWAGDGESTSSPMSKFGFKRESQTPRKVGGVSRKQKAYRSDMIESGMKQQFGIDVSKSKSRSEVTVEGSPGNFEPQASSRRKPIPRAPMIGDELGLDDDDAEGDDRGDYKFTQQISRPRSQAQSGATPQRKRYVPFENSQRGSESIVENEQVRNIWGRAYTSANAAQ